MKKWNWCATTVHKYNIQCTFLLSSGHFLESWVCKIAKNIEKSQKFKVCSRKMCVVVYIVHLTYCLKYIIYVMMCSFSKTGHTGQKLQSRVRWMEMYLMKGSRWTSIHARQFVYYVARTSVEQLVSFFLLPKKERKKKEVSWPNFLSCSYLFSCSWCGTSLFILYIVDIRPTSK